MARPVTESLEYFPLNVTFPDDPKILLLEEKHGMAGGYTAFKMLCFIYQQGYYLKWDDLMPVVYAKRVGHGMTSVEISDIVSSMMEYGLLSQTMFEKYRILTSAGIQKRWLKIIKSAKRTAYIDHKFLLTDNITYHDSEFMMEETTPLKIETHPKPEETPQSKVNILLPSKDDNNKKKRRENKSEFIPPSRADVRVYVLGLYSISSTAAEKFSDRFVSYYEANDWMVGKGSKKFKMKDWHKSVTIQWKETVFEYADKYPEAPVFDKYNPPFVA